MFIFAVTDFYFYSSCALGFCLHACLCEGIRGPGTGATRNGVTESYGLPVLAVL